MALQVLETGDRPRVLLLGDSITQQSFSVEYGGWGAALADWFCRTADIANRGFSGYTSAWVLDMLPQLLPLSRLEPHLLFATIFFGANDAVDEGDVQHVPLEEFTSNLQVIVAHLRIVAPECVIFLIGPATVDRSKWPTRSPESTRIYSEAVKTVAASTPKAAFVDLSSLTLDDLYDGLHFNKAGNAKLFSLLKELLLERYPTLCPMDSNGEPVLPMHYPPCRSFFDGSSAQALDSIRSWRW